MIESPTRNRLIEGTLQCLRERGVSGTTSRDIARRSGVNLAGITYHFGSKDELVAQALLLGIRRWLEPAMHILRREDDPVIRLVAAIHSLQNAFEKARDVLPLYLEALVQSPRYPALQAGVRALLGEMRAFLDAQISDLKTQGFLAAWVDPAAMSTLLVAIADGIALHASLEPGIVDYRAVAGQVTNLLLAARRGS